jgi:hypothetical protein
VPEHAVKIAWGATVLGGVRDGMPVLIRIQAGSVCGVDVGAGVDVVCARDWGGEQPDSYDASRSGEGRRDLSTEKKSL